MLKGCDISSYQGTSVNPRDYDFCMIKATEGASYYNPYCDRQYDMIKGDSSGQPCDDFLYGFYHYARPENNDPIAEVDNFLSKVGHHAGHCIYALDWEGEALKHGISWALEWLREVERRTGVKPLIYCQASYTRNLKPVLDEDYGLWVAHYGVDKPETGVYPFYAIWQYTSSPIDLNYFNGTREQFLKYCRR